MESEQTLQQQLDEARQTIAHLERAQHIDSVLRDADAVDLEVARLLTERAVMQMEEPDVALAIEDLKRHKPYLFRPAPSSDSTAVMGPRLETDAAAQAAEQAMTSGNRRDLLAYLRLRRRG